MCKIASEGNKRTSGKFFVTGGPVLASYKTPLARKGLSYLYFRKTKSEEYIVCDLFGYTSPTAKRWMRPCCPSISNKVSIDSFWTVEILCNGDVLIKIYWWYARVFTQTGANWKGAKISIEIILASHHCDLCDFAGTHDFGWWFLADLFLSGHVSTIILMRKCDSKYREIFFNRTFIINPSWKIQQICVCLGLLQDVLFTVRWDTRCWYRRNLWRERDRGKNSPWC